MRCYLLLTLAAGTLLTAGWFLTTEAGDAKKEGLPPLPSFPIEPKGIKVYPRVEPDKKDDAKKTAKDNEDEEILRRAELPVETAALVQFFRQRILPESERHVIEQLVRQCQSVDYRVREKATLELMARGAPVLEILRAHLHTQPNVEMMRRLEFVIQRIREKEVAPAIPAAAVRLLAQRKPTQLVETLLAYLPFAEQEAVIDEIRLALQKHALSDGKPAPALVAALTDRAAMRRAIAGEALARAAYATHKDTLHQMLHDPEALVRLRVAQALLHAKYRASVPVLIDTLSTTPLNAAWQTEDLLLRLAGSTPPPAVAMANDKKGRDQCRLAWQAWWQKHGAAIDLSRVEEPAPILGRTLIVLLDQGKVAELGPDNSTRWEVRNLIFPLDAQLLGEDRLLVSEYHGNRVTEHNLRGDVLWQIAIGGPLMAQRLANGSTFIATDSQFVEYDKDGKETLNVTLSEEGRKIMKAMKLANGEIVCMLADARVVRYDAKGQELHSFPINIGVRLFGGRIDVLPTGRVLVPHNAENKVAEYDRQGKVIWEVAFDQPVAALRMPNGNTVITSMNPTVGAAEVDRAGNVVWSYHHATRVTRALRR